jgi:molecular chaperone GrpE (heat shock protein)
MQTPTRPDPDGAPAPTGWEPTATQVEAVLDGIDGAWERAQVGLDQIARGETHSLDTLDAAPEPLETPPTAEPDHDPARLLAAAVAERDEYLDDLQRLQAAFENYRKRVEADAELQKRRQRNQILTELLPILDDLAHLRDSQDMGVAAVVASVEAAATRLGLEPVTETGVGFDPHRHEAVTVRPAADASRAGGDHADDAGTGAAGTDATGADEGNPAAEPLHRGPVVTAVLRAGWQCHGVILRPALVEVTR